ncbi:MAG: TetR/AcrR family transcriptional regulator [Candidatus Dormibacteraeota bacterium]|nr:TetR/AcrR family transcriptional regulator [Candidatus Dormibacteraeota bacterium]
MERISAPVKSRRVYDSTRRREQALRNREALLEAARHLFLSGGYAATTLAAIASAAGLSVETVHKAYGGKRGLVRAIWERGLEGTGPIPAPTRSDRMQEREAEPRRIVEQWGRLTAEVAPRAAPVLLLIRTAAATDPDMYALLREADAERLARMELNAGRLAACGGLRPGVTLEQARDVLWTFSSPDLYDLLVGRRGWPLERYGRFVAEAMIAALLPLADRERGGRRARP